MEHVNPIVAQRGIGGGPEERRCKAEQGAGTGAGEVISLMALNLADLGSLLTLPVGTVCGAAAAYSKGAGWMSPLFALLGFMIAWGVAAACRRCAYAALNASHADPRYSSKAAITGCL